MTWPEALSVVVRFLVVPYGYTLAVWSTGMVAVGRYGHPSVKDIVLFVGGAVLGFVALALPTRDAGAIPNGHAMSSAVLANLVPLFPALAVALLVRNLKQRAVGFFLTGLGATVVYISGVALLITLID